MTRRPSAERMRTAKSCRRPSRRLHAETSGPVSQTIRRRVETAPRRHGARGQGRPRLRRHTEARRERARPILRRAQRKRCVYVSPHGRAAWPTTRASRWCAGPLSWAEYEARSMSESTRPRPGLFPSARSAHSRRFASPQLESHCRSGFDSLGSTFRFGPSLTLPSRPTAR
jgi:hypothetical protein